MSETSQTSTLNPEFSKAFDRLDHSGLPPDQIRQRIIDGGIPHYVGASVMPEVVDIAQGGLDPDLKKRIKEIVAKAPENPRPFGDPRNIGPIPITRPPSARERVSS